MAVVSPNGVHLGIHQADRCIGWSSTVAQFLCCVAILSAGHCIALTCQQHGCTVCFCAESEACVPRPRREHAIETQDALSRLCAELE